MELIGCSWLCHIVNRILTSCIKTTANEKHVGQRGKWLQLIESEDIMAKHFSKQLHISLKGLQRQRLEIVKEKMVIRQGHEKSKDMTNGFSGRCRDRQSKKQV